MHRLVSLQARFLMALFGIVLLVLASFLAGAPWPESWAQWLYLVTVPGYYGLLFLLAGVGTLPLLLWQRARWLSVVLAALFLIFLLIDRGVYSLYGFHVSLLLLEMFVTDFRGMGIPPLLLGLAAGLACLVFLFCFGVFRVFSRSTVKIGRVWWWVLPVCGLLFTANSLMNAWASHVGEESITRYNAVFPLYFPVTDEKTAEAMIAMAPTWLGRPERAGAKVAADGVNYPRATLVCRPPEQPASILFLVVESWQADSLNPEVMPNLWKAAAMGQRFTQHVSSGSATVPGLFGLMYGLHPTYYDVFKNFVRSHPSQLTEQLHAAGYRSSVFTNSNLDRFGLRALFFPRVAAEDYHQPATDEAVVSAFVQSLARTGGKTPRFDFLFLTSPHSPYRYPTGYARFQPLPAAKGGFALDRFADRVPYKNDYLNSVFYTDSLIGRVFEGLQNSGRLDRTWIVVTGDHSEEFNENNVGHWGHGSNFSRWQTQTPLVVLAPGRQPAVREVRSTHQDIAPTVMSEVLGCRNAPDDYANGLNLFDLPASRDTVISSYYASAYLVGDRVVERTTGRKYEWGSVQERAAVPDATRLRALMEAESRFLRGR